MPAANPEQKKPGTGAVITEGGDAKKWEQRQQPNVYWPDRT